MRQAIEDAVKTSISFYGQIVWIKLATSRIGSGANPKGSARTDEKLTLGVLDGYNSERENHSWSDDSGAKIESQLSEIAIETVYQAELAYRKGVERRYELRKKRKAELEQELFRRKLEAERAENERIQKLEKERIDRLLQEAAAFDQAAVIRKYVQAILNAAAGSADSPAKKLKAWSEWALAEADRIDPSVNEGLLGWMNGTYVSVG